MFRYFFVVHAEKGLILRGKVNINFLKIIYAVFTLGMTVASYFSWPGSVMFDNLWPANTVKGRICLHLRLNWDKDNTKETSDIYIKPRLIVIAMTLTIGLILFHFIRRVYFFVPQICISNRSHASLGGRHRRNLVTFKELSIFYTFVIGYYLLDSLLILVLYVTQDSITQEGVFLIYHSSCVIFDAICQIILPSHILVKTLTELPEIWTNFTPIAYTFKMSGNAILPRREEPLLTVGGEGRGNQRSGGEGSGEGSKGGRGGSGRFQFVVRRKEKLGHAVIQIEDTRPDVMPPVEC